jgi:hypothetical protein
MAEGMIMVVSTGKAMKVQKLRRWKDRYGIDSSGLFLSYSF